MARVRVVGSGSWAGVGGKSDVDSLCDTEVPWKHVKRFCMLLRARSLMLLLSLREKWFSSFAGNSIYSNLT